MQQTITPFPNYILFVKYCDCAGKATAPATVILRITTIDKNMSWSPISLAFALSDHHKVIPGPNLSTFTPENCTASDILYPILTRETSPVSARDFTLHVTNSVPLPYKIPMYITPTMILHFSSVRRLWPCKVRTELRWFLVSLGIFIVWSLVIVYSFKTRDRGGLLPSVHAPWVPL